MKTNRNDLCPCGSNKKYKHCCLNKLINKKALISKSLLIALGGFIVVGFIFMLSVFNPSEAYQNAGMNRVWSEEHGHWHYFPKGSSSSSSAGSSTSQQIPSSEESNSSRSIPAPPGTPPPGKVWSEEHGHWHNLPAGSESSK